MRIATKDHLEKQSQRLCDLDSFRENRIFLEFMCKTAKCIYNRLMQSALSALAHQEEIQSNKQYFKQIRTAVRTLDDTNWFLCYKRSVIRKLRASNTNKNKDTKSNKQLHSICPNTTFPFDVFRFFLSKITSNNWSLITKTTNRSANHQNVCFVYVFVCVHCAVVPWV